MTAHSFFKGSSFLNLGGNIYTGTLLIDVDGVIARTHVPIIALTRERGHDVCMEDISAWDWGRFKDITGYSIKECINLVYEVWERDPSAIPLMDGAIVSVTNYLLKKYDAEIVTANHVSAVKPWLEQNGICTDYFRQSVEKDGGYTVFVEDNPTLEVNGHVLLLRDQPWNRDMDAPRFYHSSELPDLVARYEDRLTRR